MLNIKTKIIATIGPATLDFKVFQAMASEGIDFIRINTSYGDFGQYDHILRNLKKAKSKKKIHVILDIKNLDALAYARANKIKHIALSFAENSGQIKAVRNALPGCFVISKIETRAGVKNFDKILEASDGIMIARGDLGHAVSLERVPPLQKDFTYKSLVKEKFVITATEMLLSMVSKKMPTRAEVSDVANAVFDGSHGVMLSEETAIGKHPIETVRIMHKIIMEAEKWNKKDASINGKMKRELERHEFRVAIFGSARIKKGDRLYRQTFDLSKEIGKKHIDIITGGGPGLMKAANAGHEA
jgi:pyruvate kinase